MRSFDRVVFMPAAEQTSTPGRYREAASTLARDTALDALRELLNERNWRNVTMSHIAKAAGLSRQSLYNEFGSRRGVAQRSEERSVGKEWVSTGRSRGAPS